MRCVRNRTFCHSPHFFRTICHFPHFFALSTDIRTFLHHFCKKTSEKNRTSELGSFGRCYDKTELRSFDTVICVTWEVLVL